MFSPKCSLVSVLFASISCCLPMSCLGQAVIWDQQPDATLTPVIDLEVPPVPEFSTYLLNDVTVALDTVVTSVTVYFTNNSGTWESSVFEARLNVFPGDFTPFDPSIEGILVPVTVTNIGGGVLEITASKRFNLSAGVNWIGLTPVVPDDLTQEFRFDTGNTIGEMTVFRNPLDGFGLGSDWLPAGLLAPGFEDAAITLIGPNLTESADTFPDDATVVRGFEASGQFTDVCASDDVRWVFNPGFVLNSNEAPVWVEFDGTAIFSQSNTLSVEFESQAGTPGLTLTIEEFNFSTNSYEAVSVESESVNVDVQRVITLSGHESSDRDIRIRAGWRPTGITTKFPWEVRIDSVVWRPLF